MMKIVAEKEVMTIEIIKKGIVENIGIIQDIGCMDGYTGDMYKNYRLIKATEKIQMYLKEVELIKKEK